MSVYETKLTLKSGRRIKEKFSCNSENEIARYAKIRGYDVVSIEIKSIDGKEYVEEEDA